MNGDEWLPGGGGANNNGKVFHLFASNLYLEHVAKLIKCFKKAKQTWKKM